jgi:hypothetical protein
MKISKKPQPRPERLRRHECCTDTGHGKKQDGAGGRIGGAKHGPFSMAPTPDRRGLASQSNQLPTDSVKRLLLERWPPVNPETQTRCNKLIELEGCRALPLCRGTNGGVKPCRPAREVKGQACRPHRRPAVFIFVLFREPPCLLQFCNDI